uniref:Uncharacterized protein n=1 Tax=Tetranychus urticae TaxID=32264 RepID=T1L106_TETUR
MQKKSIGQKKCKPGRINMHAKYKSG